MGNGDGVSMRGWDINRNVLVGGWNVRWIDLFVFMNGLVNERRKKVSMWWFFVCRLM